MGDKIKIEDAGLDIGFLRDIVYLMRKVRLLLSDYLNIYLK